MTAPTITEKARAVAEAISPDPVFPEAERDISQLSDCGLWFRWWDLRDDPAIFATPVVELAPLDGNFLLAVLKGMRERGIYMHFSPAFTDPDTDTGIAPIAYAAWIEDEPCGIPKHTKWDPDPIVSVISAAYDAIQEGG